MKIKRRLSIRTVLSAVVLAAVAGTESTSQLVFSKVALTGEVASGVENATFLHFDQAVIDTLGNTVFRGFLTGEDIVAPFDSFGIWSQTTGEGGISALGLVARGGDPAPGLPGDVFFAGFEDPRILASGQVAFYGLLAGNGVNGGNNLGIWTRVGDLSAPGALNLLAREGDPAPIDQSNAVFALLNSAYVLNEQGQLAFRAILMGDGVANDLSIWSQGQSDPGPGDLKLVARRNDPAPGTESGTTFTGFQLPVFNDLGQVAFRGGLAGSGVDVSNADGIWSQGRAMSGPGELQLVVRRGDSAPGVTGEAHFTSFADPSIGKSGQVMFFGTIAGDGITAQNDSGIWLQSQPGATDSEFDLIVREGNAAPDTPEGVVFGSSLRPALNSSGDVAVLANLAGGNVDATNNSGIWSTKQMSDGSVRLNLIVREGEMAPGTSPGTVFSSISTPSFALNDSGQMVFISMLDGEEVDSSNDRALWGADTTGSVQLILREGDQISVSDAPLASALRTVASFETQEVSSGADLRPLGFNDLGQIAIVVSFTDGSSGVFVATIPEPSALALCGLLPCGLARRRDHLPHRHPPNPRRVA